MPACSRPIRLGRCGSRASGDVRSRGGLSSASRCASSNRTGISQNSWVAGEEILMAALMARRRTGPRREAGLLALAGAPGARAAPEGHVAEAGFGLLAEPLVEDLVLGGLAE